MHDRPFAWEDSNNDQSLSQRANNVENVSMSRRHDVQESYKNSTLWMDY